MTARTELVFFDGCPHADSARARLHEALTSLGLEPKWEEWDTGLATTPAAYRRFGSPTILCDGRDINGGVEGSGMGCVVGGGPSLDVITSALRAIS